jgi:hypothetical protein
MAVFPIVSKDLPYKGTYNILMDNFSVDASIKTARTAIEAADLRLMTINRLI